MTGLDNNENDIKLAVINGTSIEKEVSTENIDNKTFDNLDEKKLLRKLDFHLIPTMILLYLLSYLDRVNIGQAKIDGLMESLHLTSAQYNACLSIFFATYVAFEIPSNLILKRLRPS
jgi:sugar phosphate permease